MIKTNSYDLFIKKYPNVELVANINSKDDVKGELSLSFSPKNRDDTD